LEERRETRQREREKRRRQKNKRGKEANEFFPHYIYFISIIFTAAFFRCRERHTERKREAFQRERRKQERVTFFFSFATNKNERGKLKKDILSFSFFLRARIRENGTTIN
jgi:hypothetical protein